MLNERETEEEEGKSISCECCMQSLPAQAKEHQGDIGVKEKKRRS